jgi:hypothetical protein
VSWAYVHYHVNHDDLSLVRLLPFAHYKQDDTAETLIVRRMYPKPAFWNEPTMIGYSCANCESVFFQNGRLNKGKFIPRCPPDQHGVRVSDLMIIHGWGGSMGIRRLINAIPSAPSDLMLYRHPPKRMFFICRNASLTQMYIPGNIRDEFMLEAKDLPTPLIDYSTLRDDDLP